MSMPKISHTTKTGLNKDQKVRFNRKISDYKKFLEKDQDFDYLFILRMLKYKLKRTRDHIISHNMLVNAKEVGTEIGEVETLLQRVIDDKYEDEQWDKLEKKHGKSLYGINQPVELSQDVAAASEAAFEDRQADLKKAFDMMLDKIWFWWC